MAGIGIIESRRRSGVVEAALRLPEVRRLSNEEISRRLNIAVDRVRWARRRMEARCEIERVTLRINRRGRLMDVAHIGSAMRKQG